MIIKEDSGHSLARVNRNSVDPAKLAEEVLKEVAIIEFIGYFLADDGRQGLDVALGGKRGGWLLTSGRRTYEKENIYQHYKFCNYYH